MSSIRRSFRTMVLEKKKKSQSPSGAWKDTWVKDRDIQCAIYPISNSVMLSNNVKFNQSTNNALSTDKNIKESESKDGNRINDNGTSYIINFANPTGRYTQLLLQKVIING